MKYTVDAPEVWTRLGGILYLVIIAAGLFGEVFVRGTLIVAGNPAATADNVAGSMLLWRALAIC